MGTHHPMGRMPDPPVGRTDRRSSPIRSELARAPWHDLGRQHDALWIAVPAVHAAEQQLRAEPAHGLVVGSHDRDRRDERGGQLEVVEADEPDAVAPGRDRRDRRRRSSGCSCRRSRSEDRPSEERERRRAGVVDVVAVMTGEGGVERESRILEGLTVAVEALRHRVDTQVVGQTARCAGARRR